MSSTEIFCEREQTSLSPELIDHNEPEAATDATNATNVLARNQRRSARLLVHQRKNPRLHR
jgi:hypothetical protein